MKKESSSIRFLAVAIASVLLGSTLILSAVGPARAGELPRIMHHDCPAAPPYLA